MSRKREMRTTAIRGMKCLGIFAAVLTMFCTAHRSQAAEKLEAATLAEGAEGIAKLVSPVLKGEDQDSVVLSGFASSFDVTKTTGPRLRAELIKALKSNGIESSDKAGFTLIGRFRVAAANLKVAGGAQVNKVPGIRIHYELVSSSDKRFQEGDVLVKDPAEVAEADGSNLPEIKGDKGDLDKELQDNVLKAITSEDHGDEFFVDGTKLFPNEGSKLAVEILKAGLMSSGQAPPLKSYEPTPIVLRKSDPESTKSKGAPFIDIEPKEVYAVRIYNGNDHEVAAKLTIDGLSMFHFSEERSQRSDFWIFGPGQSYEIVGWHRKGDQSDSFLVGEYSKDDGGKEIDDSTAKYGTISVEFRRSYLSEKDVPPSDKGRLKTERGPPVKQPNKLVTRFFGKIVRARLAIRYDRQFEDLPQ